MNLFVTLALLAAGLQTAPPSGVEVTDARFVAIDARQEPPRIEEARRIPYRPETSCFAWVLHVTPRPGQVTLREELRLPAPAANWGTAEGTTVHADRAGATTRRAYDLAEGLLANEWCISPGDPLGAHNIRVYEGDRLLHQFDFEVVPEPTGLPTI